MQTVDEKPETIHLYVVREKEPKPSVLPIILLALSLAVLFTFCALIPYQQPVTRAVIRVPAVLLPIRTFTATVVVVPTGIKVYPATTAHGWLTFSNGSVIGLSVPRRFTVGGAVTDSAVYVPPATANGFGMSTVSAHLLTSGINMSTFSINEVIGASLFVRNLQPFTGGRPAYSVKYATEHDEQLGLLRTRANLASITPGLHYPCVETASIKLVIWSCQFFTFKLPDYMHITGIKIIGKNLLISVWFVARPARAWVK